MPLICSITLSGCILRTKGKLEECRNNFLLVSISAKRDKTFDRQQIVNQSLGLHVILIGSTGYLGKFLLSMLLKDLKVRHVYCLNRSATAAQQWKTHVDSHHIDIDHQKVTERESFMEELIQI